MTLLLGRPICQILGGHDWEKRGRPVVETARVVPGSDAPAGFCPGKIRRFDLNEVEPKEDPVAASAGTARCTITAVAGSDITVGDLVTLTGEEPYFECRRCGFVGESQWDDERLPAPVRMRGTDALVWWFLHGDEPSGWRWVPESERIAEGRE